MSAATLKVITSIPPGGLEFGLTPGLKINSITPLAVGDLVMKPASPLESQTTETIAITEQLVGITFPGLGQTMLQEGTTALPLVVVFSPESVPMVPIRGGGGATIQEQLTVQQEQLTVQQEQLAASRTVKALDIALTGGVWVVRLKSTGGAFIASVNVGTVAVSGAGAVAIPLDLVAMGGSPASEVRIFGAGLIELIHSTPANAGFPVAELQVEDAEVVAHNVSKIHAIGAGITRLAISWGG